MAKEKDEIFENRQKPFDTGEMAQILGVSSQTVAEYCNKGIIRCIRTLGGHRRITVGEAERVLSKIYERGEKRWE